MASDRRTLKLRISEKQYGTLLHALTFLDASANEVPEAKVETLLQALRAAWEEARFRRGVW